MTIADLKQAIDACPCDDSIPVYSGTSRNILSDVEVLDRNDGDPYLSLTFTNEEPGDRESVGVYSMHYNEFIGEPVSGIRIIPCFWLNKETWNDEYKSFIIKSLQESPIYCMADGILNGERKIVKLYLTCVAEFEHHTKAIEDYINLKNTKL